MRWWSVINNWLSDSQKQQLSPVGCVGVFLGGVLFLFLYRFLIEVPFSKKTRAFLLLEHVNVLIRKHGRRWGWGGGGWGGEGCRETGSQVSAVLRSNFRLSRNLSWSRALTEYIETSSGRQLVEIDGDFPESEQQQEIIIKSGKK